MAKRSANPTGKSVLLGMVCLLGCLCWAEQPDRDPVYRTLAIKVERPDARRAWVVSSSVKVDPAKGQLLMHVATRLLRSEEIEELTADTRRRSVSPFRLHAIAPDGTPLGIGLDMDFASPEVSRLWSKQTVLLEGTKYDFALPLRMWTGRTASGTLALRADQREAGAYRLRGVYWWSGCLFIVDTVLQLDQWVFLPEPPPASFAIGTGRSRDEE